jgi:hypothetical protein
MAGLKSVLFGDIQYQISRPIQNPDDGYYYQRMREITRDGELRAEFIVKSYEPNSPNGLVDPERGFDLLYGSSIYITDVFTIGWTALGLGSNPIAAGSLGRAINKFYEHATNGGEYPSGLATGYESWSGTDEPWNRSTLQFDQNPVWSPGTLERFFSQDTPAAQIAKYASLEESAESSASTSDDGGRTIVAQLMDTQKLVIHERPDGFADSIITEDSNGRITGVDRCNPDGEQPMTIKIAADGAVTSAWNGGQVAGDIGAVFGSNLGRLLGGNSLVGQLSTGTVIGAIGKEVGNALFASASFSLDAVVTHAFGTLAGGSGVGALPGGAIATVSSLLMSEFADALNLPRFEAGLFQTGGTVITNQLITNAYGMMTGALDSSGHAGVFQSASRDRRALVQCRERRCRSLGHRGRTLGRQPGHPGRIRPDSCRPARGGVDRAATGRPHVH